MRARYTKQSPKYAVTLEGKVISLDFKNTGKKKYLKLTLASSGYLVANIHRKVIPVHRLVAEAFIPNPNNFPCVNHKDGIRTNNHLDNLEWCSYSHNNFHAYRELNKQSPLKGKTGSLCKNSKPVEQILDGETIKVWGSASEAGRNGFSQAHISSVCRGERKHHKGFIWKYR